MHLIDASNKHGCLYDYIHMFAARTYEKILAIYKHIQIITHAVTCLAAIECTDLDEVSEQVVRWQLLGRHGLRCDKRLTAH